MLEESGLDNKRPEYRWVHTASIDRLPVSRSMNKRWHGRPGGRRHAQEGVRAIVRLRKGCAVLDISADSSIRLHELEGLIKLLQEDLAQIVYHRCVHRLHKLLEVFLVAF